ncbi:hypothetical protein GHI93_12745 [Lactococcus hircilactis]|uniref:Uncharacterized protein n=1 Tax=Lactococcus hircilactis TaxID=1494462 RepID=A0A7X1ZAC9_9LACT|nr:hypothetical protein [Lactococcus hircilactis]MQW40768.1 hypothetical protein [Lactococcus hircilactis]
MSNRSTEEIKYVSGKDHDIKVDYDDKDIDYFHNEFKKKLEEMESVQAVLVALGRCENERI